MIQLLLLLHVYKWLEQWDWFFQLFHWEMSRNSYSIKNVHGPRWLHTQLQILRFPFFPLLPNANGELNIQAICLLASNCSMPGTVPVALCTLSFHIHISLPNQLYYAILQWHWDLVMVRTCLSSCSPWVIEEGFNPGHVLQLTIKIVSFMLFATLVLQSQSSEEFITVLSKCISSTKKRKTIQFKDSSPKKGIQVSSKHMKRHSTLLVIREGQTITTWRHHTRFHTIKNPENSKCWWKWIEIGTLFTLLVEM